MGQLQAAPKIFEAPDQRYDAYDIEALQRIAAQRGLTLSSERAMLAAMLRAYDAGLQAAAASKASCRPSVSGGRGSKPTCHSDAEVLQQMLDAPGLKAMDIGGTLVKMALALPLELASEEPRFPATFGATGRTRSELEFPFELCGVQYLICFASGATSQIAHAISGLQGCQGLPSGPPRATGALLQTLSDESPVCSSVASTADTLSVLEALEDGGMKLSSRCSSSVELASLGRCEAPSPKIFTAGGGAHKFAQLFREALQVDLVPVKELSAVVDGLLFLMDVGPSASGLVYEVAEDGSHVSAEWPEPPFPFLVVNIGSGVSILRVNSAAEGDYVRVGGTACGGGTFLGLAQALTSASTFEEALALAEGGDASRCDLLVRDIYGDEGSVSLGLRGGMTASNCGLLCEEGRGFCEKDVARALLQMVTQQSALLSAALARQSGCLDRVFFAGGFMTEGNHLARRAIAANFRSLGGRVYFLRHCDFLGALGSLRSCIKDMGMIV